MLIFCKIQNKPFKIWQRIKKLFQIGEISLNQAEVHWDYFLHLQNIDCAAVFAGHRAHLILQQSEFESKWDKSEL